MLANSLHRQKFQNRQKKFKVEKNISESRKIEPRLDFNFFLDSVIFFLNFKFFFFLALKYFSGFQKIVSV